MKQALTHVRHCFEPVYDSDSKILILGTIPSPKSREDGFYYGHPRNRFWQVISTVLNEPLPLSIDDKRSMLLRNKIALWDVVGECDISGGSDSSIKNAVANDISPLLDSTDIKAVFVTGKKALELYSRLILPKSGVEAIYLPSPSPANCAVKYDELVLSYKVILDYL